MGGRLLLALGLLAHPAFSTWAAAQSIAAGQPEQDAAHSTHAVWERWWVFNRERFLNPRLPNTPCSWTGRFAGGGWKLEPLDRLRPSDKLVRDQVVPALLSALRAEQEKAEPAGEIVRPCLLALAQIGDERDGEAPIRDEIATFVAGQPWDVQESAVIALGVLGDEGSTTLLSALLFDDDVRLRSVDVRMRDRVPVRTRACAAIGLGLIGSRASPAGRQAIVAALVHAFESEPRNARSSDVRTAVLTAVGLIQLSFEPRLGPVEEENDAAPKPEQVTNLQEQVLWLLHHLEQSEHPELERAQIPLALARLVRWWPAFPGLRDQVTARLVARIHAGEHSPIASACILALAELGDCDGDPLDASIRAVLAARASSSSDPRGACLALLSLGCAAARPGAGKGESQWDPGGLDGARAVLIERLQSGPALQRPWAALGLGLLEHGLVFAQREPSPEGRAALLTALRNSCEPGAFGALAVAAGMAYVPGAQAVLRDRLGRARNWEVIGRAALGLGLIDDVEAVPLVLQATQRNKFPPPLVGLAAEALSLIAERPILDDLVDQLGTVSGRISQADVAAALGRIGDAQSIAPLLELLQSKEHTYRVRGLAAAALGDLADKEGRLWHARLSEGVDPFDPAPLLSSPEWTGILDRR